MPEEKGTYYSDCELTEEKDGFILKCKKGKPAVRVQTEESEED